MSHESVLEQHTRKNQDAHLTQIHHVQLVRSKTSLGFCLVVELSCLSFNLGIIANLVFPTSVWLITFSSSSFLVKSVPNEPQEMSPGLRDNIFTTSIHSIHSTTNPHVTIQLR